MSDSSNSDLLRVALDNTATALKSIVANCDTQQPGQCRYFGDLINARKCVEMALISLAAIHANDHPKHTRDILSSVGFPDIM